MLSRVVALSAALMLAACQSPPPSPPEATGSSGPRPLDEPAGELCDPLGFSPSALVAAGVVDESSAILPNGRLVAPEGQIIVVGGAPNDIVLSADGAYAYVLRRNGGVLVVDMTTAEVIQTSGAVRGFHGIALGTDGAELWTTAMSGTVYRFPVLEDGTLGPADTIPVEGFPVEVLVHPDGERVYVMSNTNSHIYEIDTTSMEVLRVLHAGRSPMALALDDTATTLFASNVGGDSVTVIDLASGEAVASVPVCANPEGMVVPAGSGRLYVACSNSDTVAVIDIASRAVVETFDLTGDAEGLTGGAANGIAYSPALDRIIVSLARRNALAIVRPSDGLVEGELATGHYPTALTLTPDGRTVIATAMKGFGSQDSNWDIRGQVNVIPIPQGDEEMALATERVRSNNLRPSRFYPEDCGVELPPPLAGGDDRPIRHVVLVVRENKTYDVMLGDLEGTNGDPRLAIFGEGYTPNLHRLARQYTNMDNFYADAEHSLQGHMWTTQVDCNDLAEKTRQFEIPLEGFDPAVNGGGGTVFDHCYANGVTFRNYGEVSGFGAHVVDDFADFIDRKYPFFNLAISDEEKIAEFARELDQGILMDFTYISLPNDHTSGSKSGAPTPQWYVGDNDAATGELIEALSHSPFWPETAVFIIEDDPQGPGDHVHAHRSICVAVSPWVRHGVTSGVLYSTGSLYRTIEMLLGLPPINRNTFEAPPMVDIFATGGEGDEPDFTPYEAVPNPIPYAVNAKDAPMAKESAAIDWSEPDNAPGLPIILWRVMRGDEPIPDYAKTIRD